MEKDERSWKVSLPNFSVFPATISTIGAFSKNSILIICLVCEFLFLTDEKIENERDFVSRIVEMILLKCIPQVQIEISNCLKDKVRTNKA